MNKDDDDEDDDDDDGDDDDIFIHFSLTWFHGYNNNVLCPRPITLAKIHLRFCRCQGLIVYNCQGLTC